MTRSPEQWKQLLIERRVLMMHDGNPKRKHPILTSGLHGGGFLNGTKIIEDPDFMEEMCEGVVAAIRNGPDLGNIDVVVGPAMGGIELSYVLGRMLGCRRGYVEKATQPGQAHKHMIFDRFDGLVQPGDRVLLVEDVVTTGGSTLGTAEAVKEAGGIVIPAVAAFLNRSGKPVIEGSDLRIISLLTINIPNYTPPECPLCKAGSVAISEAKKHWAELTCENPQ